LRDWGMRRNSENEFPDRTYEGDEQRPGREKSRSERGGGTYRDGKIKCMKEQKVFRVVR